MSVELTVVIPALNEELSIASYGEELLVPLRSLGRPFEVVIVDDGSTDDTAGAAERLGPEVRVARHGQNRGLAQAVQTGIREARGALVVTLDADLTFRPADIRRLLDRFDHGDCDLVCGSPHAGGYSAEIARWRVGVSRAASGIYSALLGQPVTSVSGIFRLYRTAQVQALLPLRAQGFEVNAELLFELVKRGARVGEVPAALGSRSHGESRLNYRKEIPRNAKLIGRIVRWRLGRSA